MFLLLLLYAISTFPLTAAILPYTQPFFLLGARMSIAGILLLIYSCIYKQLQLHKDHIIPYAQIIIFAIFLPYALRYYGLQTASAPRAYLLYNCGPIITYILTHIFTLEKITKQRTLALGISFIGLLLTLNHSLTAYISTPFGLPEIALILSILSFSYGWIIMHKLIVHNTYNPALINGIAMIGGGIIALGASVLVEPYPYVTHMFTFLSLLAPIIIISNLIAHNLYAFLLKTYSLTLLQLGYWLIPSIHTLCHALYTQQAPTYTSLCATLFLMTGFMILYRQEKTAAHYNLHLPLLNTPIKIKI